MNFQLILSEWEDVDKCNIEANIPETEKNMTEVIEIEMGVAYESKLVCL